MVELKAPRRLRTPGARTDAERDAERRTRADRAWYDSARWKHKRAAQLMAEPLCRFCAERGLTVAGSVADHVRPHRGDYDRFWGGELQTLCAPCHSSDKQRIEKANDKAKAGRWTRGFDSGAGVP